MIGLEWLENLVKYAIASAWVKDGSPVSLLIVSDTEAGKTKLLEKFSQTKGVLYINSFTRYGLLRDYLPKIQTGEVKTIIVPDMVQLVGSVSPAIQNDVIIFFNSLLEEGLKSASTYHVSINFDKPVRMNLITAIPKGIFQDKRRLKKWMATGFLSRMLPASYSYDKELIAQIFAYITYFNYLKEEPVRLHLEEREVSMKPELAEKLLVVTEAISQEVGTYGFRIQRHLQELARGKALLEGRSEVTEEDVREIIKLSSWCNLSFNPVKLTNSGGSADA